ncbi:MAG: rhodanese-like domain-containing protein [Acidobacteria bacterium]|nr:rhodanese-like domain-containing protein [Acidobacteriota bacterium]
MADVPEIDVADLETILDDVHLVDVREPDEYTDGHVPGAVLIPLATVPDSLDRFPRDRTVHVICAAGARSARAVEFLRANGVDAVNIAGGTGAWISSGRSVITGSDPV